MTSNSRLRVVFSIGGLHGGGSERQLVSLLRNLDRERFEPLLYLIYRTGPLLKLVPPDVPITSFEERVTPSRIYLPGLMHSLRVRDFTRFLKEVRADVSYDRTFLMTLISADGAQRAGIPNVSTIVTDPETGFAPVAGRFQWFKRRRLHRLYNKSARVLAVSDGAREAAIRFYGIEPRKIRTLTNGIDLELIRQQAAEPVDEPTWSTEWRTHSAPGTATGTARDTVAVAAGKPFRIVSAGRLNEQKGFHLLIDAVAELQSRLPDRPLQLAILGEGECRKQLQDQIRQLRSEERFLLPGYRENAAAWYRSADVFVLPSLIEGMPNVLLEAMALGTPVVSTDCRSGPREILQDGELGELVRPGSVSDLADGIERVLSDQPSALRRAQLAQRVVEEKHSISAVARRLEEILLAVAG